jgi:hypothetical protein
MSGYSRNGRPYRGHLRCPRGRRLGSTAPACPGCRRTAASFFASGCAPVVRFTARSLCIAIHICPVPRQVGEHSAISTVDASRRQAAGWARCRGGTDGGKDSNAVRLDLDTRYEKASRHRWQVAARYRHRVTSRWSHLYVPERLLDSSAPRVRESLFRRRCASGAGRFTRASRISSAGSSSPGRQTRIP